MTPVAAPTRRAHVRLESAVATSFRCRRAADALDIDSAAKAVHELTVDGIDLTTPWSLGVIVGASGSGKTTLAREVFGVDCTRELLNMDAPVIDQLPKAWSYDECAAALAGVGLTSVPCWIRPAYTLSNGQRARAEAALQMAHATDGIVVIDEWTSVVDRTVGKVMSHCVQKHARRTPGVRIVLLSCHYDVLEWLNPDWVIDCNRAEYLDRRSVQSGFRRSEQLSFDIRRVDARSWSYFEKYHYLSAFLPGGHRHLFGLFHGDDQIGFQAWHNYVPRVGAQPMQLHSNRTVIHPDFAGLGLGIRVITETAHQLHAEFGDTYALRAKFSSTPVYRAMSKSPHWMFTGVGRQIGRTRKGGNMGRVGGFRENVTTYQFAYVP